MPSTGQYPTSQTSVKNMVSVISIHLVLLLVASIFLAHFVFENIYGAATRTNGGCVNVSSNCFLSIMFIYSYLYFHEIILTQFL